MKKIEFTDDLKALLYFRFKDAEARQLTQLNQNEQQSLTLAQMRVFSLLLSNELQGNQVTISDIAKWMNISRQAVQKTVSTMVGRGLMELVESPKNRSAKLIQLTKDGQELWARLQNISEQMEKDLKKQMGSERLALLKEILKQNWG